MAIEGRLRELALSDVFQLLDLSKKTGRLSVHHGTGESSAVVSFEQGYVTGAESPDIHGRIGRLLVRSGTISQADLDAALLEQRRRPGVPLGILVVELGLVDAADVAARLTDQVKQTVFELFRWKDGYFRFEEGQSGGDAGVQVRIATQSLLMELARRTDEWASRVTRVPHGDVVLSLATPGRDHRPLDLAPAEWAILTEIDGERTIKEIAADLERTDVEVAGAADGLLRSGIVVFHEARPAGSPSQPLLLRALREADELLRRGYAAEARAVTDRLLSEHPEQSDVCLTAGRVLLALHRWHEASELLSRAVKLDPLSAAAYFHLGFSAARTGDFARAEHAWKTFLRLPEARGAEAATAQRGIEALGVLESMLAGAQA
jgi:hypothetical protein